jgi:aspartyl-tRNA(Asn)/glutamyl-tRNA(Gln) amidotransferase subunit B
MGLEVHAQIATQSKLMSGAGVNFGDSPNTNVSLVDAGFPGMLPVLNQEAIRQAVISGIGLNATINLWSQFDRKHYFYPDNPQGYQITQQFYPLVGEGVIPVDLEDGTTFHVGLERIHVEQDAGKSIHFSNHSGIDLNRCGTALMEIVSKPDIRSSDEAVAYVQKLRNILVYLGTCDGNMARGNLRADVNVSVRRPGEALGTRCEIKNVNSFKFIQQAIEYEARRQIQILEAGGTIDQETRLYDPETGETRSMRSKEDAQDYRYFPDPDLRPLILDEAWVDELRRTLPELPDAKKQRFMDQYGLSAYDAQVLTSERVKADYYEEAAKEHDPKLVANWITNELSAFLTANQLDFDTNPITSSTIADLVGFIEDGTINSKLAKDVWHGVWTSRKTPGEIIEEQDLRQNNDTGALEAIVDRLISENPDKVAALQTKPQAIGWFVGQIMIATERKASPDLANKLLKEKLGLA